MKGFIQWNKGAALFTLLVMLVGTIGYFAYGKDAMASVDASAVFSGARYKVAYSEDGAMKVFALANESALLKLKVSEGNTVPKKKSMVLGFREAQVMKDEDLFYRVGDRIDDFFGTQIIVGGIFEKTGTIVDDFHFLGPEKFSEIKGEENRVFVKMKGSTPKLFYWLPIGVEPPKKFELAQGSLDSYAVKELGGRTYYPLVIGSEEAKMMKEEKLFSSPGDLIHGFFGKDVFVAGVLKETKTAMDMMHFMPLREDEVG
ncbi:MAG: hypothetical protein V1909_04175 [Candidatus Micrarchaeota archaeon]